MLDKNQSVPIRIKRKTKEKLHKMKKLGESYDDVINRKLI